MQKDNVKISEQKPPKHGHIQHVQLPVAQMSKVFEVAQCTSTTEL